MKFSLLYEMQKPRPWGEDDIYDCFWEALDQAKLADELGFHSVWSVEHHFLDQFSVASSPEVWLSAVAQHTRRIRIGHGVRLLPFKYNHPIRSAEMAAVLDIMSNGRLEFGTGRSASAIELQGFGIEPNETRGEWDEALRMIPQMWTQEEFSWESDRITIPPRNVLPKPRQKPHPPLWMSGTQPDSAILAGERGIGFMHFSMSDPKGMDQKVQSYRDAIVACSDPVGAFVNDQFAAFTAMFCGEDDADAANRAGEAICWYANLVEAVYASLAGLGDDASYAWYKERLAEEGVKQRSLEELVERHSALVGGPERCIDSIRWYEQQGVDVMMLLVQAGSLKHDDICDSMRRFASEVMPKFS